MLIAIAYSTRMGKGWDALVSTSKHEGMRMEMLKAFDETKAGVKGLLDSGIDKIPAIFVKPSEDPAKEFTREKIQLEVPLIDLSGIWNQDKRKMIVQQVKSASETWGFFQVVNHGIPLTLLDEMVEGVREFNEQDLEEKKKFYTRDKKKDVRFNCSYDLFTSETASWRDTMTINFPDLADQHLYEELPFLCRDSIIEYSKNVKVLGNSVLGLLSEALGLEIDHLKDMECTMGHQIHLHYYPSSPDPDLTMGVTKHTDPGFLTILVQSQTVSALQVLHQNQWVDIHPTPGALVINIGDLLQLVSNGRFKSGIHRVTSNIIGPRISVACFFAGPLKRERSYGPIQELISDEKPPIYREILLSAYAEKFVASGLDIYQSLDNYKL